MCGCARVHVRVKAPREAARQISFSEPLFFLIPARAPGFFLWPGRERMCVCVWPRVERTCGRGAERETVCGVGYSCLRLEGERGFPGENIRGLYVDIGLFFLFS